MSPRGKGGTRGSIGKTRTAGRKSTRSAGVKSKKATAEVKRGKY